MFRAKILCFRRQLLHRPIIGEQDKSVTIGLPNKMFDPVRERVFVLGIARIRHFADDEDFHLLSKIKWTAELDRFGLSRPRPTPRVSLVITQVRPSRKSICRKAGAISIGAALSDSSCPTLPVRSIQ